MTQPPRVRIISPNGVGVSSTVEVDGVPIPCTKATWYADADGVAHADLEIPRVAIDAEAREVVAHYVPSKSCMPMFWWQCPCGMEMGCATPESAATTFRTPSNHIVSCEYVPPVAGHE